MSEKVITRAEARERLNVSPYGYFKLIRKGILAEPVRLPNSHPFHTESQILAAQRKLNELATPKPRLFRKSKPVNRDLFQPRG